ncbi:hypothetical protein RHRU231_700009 [Rhodococcus ruber]|uniref:Uncharacterized protein n=1 Tax=Rhodococcus ruber TaxID=1830 RepID=A0A098BRH7_9NOCA|nr:hypothetical protein RHRU231_700009 [Rhodococcus ruber]
MSGPCRVSALVKNFNQTPLVLDERVNPGGLAVKVTGDGTLFLQRWHHDLKSRSILLVNRLMSRAHIERLELSGH